MAYPNKGKGSPVLPWLCKLLLEVHLQLLQHCPPLYALTCKTQQWVWGLAEHEAFDALKNAVTSTPVLTFPSQSGRLQLECDASNFATGAVLSQVQADSAHQPVNFMSKDISD